MARDVIVIDYGRTLFKSKAWMKLPGSSVKMYMHFLCKRQVAKYGRKGKEKKAIINNGKIQFTLSEAQKLLGKSRPTVIKAKDDLVKYGFIDISHPGGAYDGDPGLYAISDRWMKYGTPDFEEIIRPKDTRQRGFKKYPENIYKRNSG